MKLGSFSKRYFKEVIIIVLIRNKYRLDQRSIYVEKIPDNFLYDMCWSFPGHFISGRSA